MNREKRKRQHAAVQLLRQARAEATAGEWEFVVSFNGNSQIRDNDEGPLAIMQQGQPEQAANARLVVLAVNNLGWLLDLAEQMIGVRLADEPSADIGGLPGSGATL